MFNKFLKKAKKFVKPSKKITTPTHSDPYMLQLQIQSINELLSTQIIQEVLQMKIKLSFIQNLENQNYSTFSKDERLLILVNIFHITSEAKTLIGLNNSEDSFLVLDTQDNILHQKLDNCSYQGEKKNQYTIFLSQSKFLDFANYIYGIWKFTQTKQVMSNQREQLKNQNMANSISGDSTNNILKIFTLDSNVHSQENLDLNLELNKHHGDVISADIDNKLVGTDQYLQKIQDEENEEYIKCPSLFQIETIVPKGICCTCHRDLEWDQFVLADESIPDQTNKNSNKELNDDILVNKSQFVDPDLLQDNNHDQISDFSSVRRCSDINEDDNDDNVSVKTIPLSKRRSKNNTNSPEDDQISEFNTNDIESQLISSSDVTKEYRVDDNGDFQECDSLDGDYLNNSFSDEVLHGCNKDIASKIKSICGIKINKSGESPLIDYTSLRNTQVFTKTTHPHPTCQQLHRLCISCKDTVFGDKSDKFCSECTFGESGIKSGLSSDKFRGFLLVADKVDVCEVLQTKLEGFYQFLKSYSSEQSFRLV